MDKLKEILAMYNNDFTRKLVNQQTTFDDILLACGNKWDVGCGSYLFDGRDYTYCLDTYPKQKLLYDVAKDASDVLEIGVYMGHSLLIMLLANPRLNITCIDIDFTYAQPSVEVLKKHFPQSNIEFIHGNSLDVIPNINKKFDLFHIDGHHDIEFIEKEFEYVACMTKTEILNVVFDDVETCRPLKRSILETSNILTCIEPTCRWPNCFFKIQLESSV